MRRIERTGDAVIIHVDRTQRRAIYREHNLHLRLSAMADRADDALMSFLTEFGPMQARRVPSVMILARDHADAWAVALEDLYFAPPVAGVSKAIDVLAARLASDVEAPWLPPHELRGPLRDFLQCTDPEPDVGHISMIHLLEGARSARALVDASNHNPLADWVRSHRDLNLPIVETLSELRYGATLLHDALAAIRWARENEPPGWRAPIWNHASPPDSREQAMAFACDVVNHALLNYSPRLVPVPSDFPATGAGADRARLRPAGLLDFACMTLAVDLADEGGYRVCPRCSTVFRVGRGAAKYGEHRRIDSKFCSEDCQRAAGKERDKSRRRHVTPARTD